jgi:hypothetical protein
MKFKVLFKAHYCIKLYLEIVGLIGIEGNIPVGLHLGVLKTEPERNDMDIGQKIHFQNSCTSILRTLEVLNMLSTTHLQIIQNFYS